MFAWTLRRRLAHKQVAAELQKSALKREEQMQLYQMEMEEQEKQHAAKLRPLHKEQDNQHLRQRHEQKVQEAVRPILRLS